MNTIRPGWAPVVMAALSALITGCATTGSSPAIEPGAAATGEVYRFDPAPVAHIGENDLEPIARRNATELLEEARAEFEAGNAAQEQGDPVDAYEHYTLMMELLLEADLDPTVFYELRDDFNQILNRTTHLARTFERVQPESWNEEVMELARRSELSYPTPLNDRVLAEIQHIQKSYPNGFQAGLNRSGKYLPYIREQFAQAGLPQDLVWLAMVESQFTPKINSHAGAGGMWQFMRSTGQRYGLRVDGYIDERYDWKQSTHAAIAYLQQLYEIFDGNWPLAISAYNMGESGLDRAITANGGERDLWRLIETPPAANRIRRETKKFYAKLLASSIIAQNPEQYGFTHEPAPELRTSLMEIRGAYALHDIDEKVGLPTGTMATLNPQMLRGITPPQSTVYLSVPSEMRTQIASAIETMEELQPSTHIVQRGETLSEIARLYRVTSKELQSLNDIRSARSLQIGQRLVIPGRMAAPTRAAVNGTAGNIHTVSSGESLSAIAARYSVSVRDLQQWNSLGASTRIHVSDRLYVTPPASGTTAAAATRTHTVRRGENASVIAKRYGVATDEILRWNRLNRNSTLRVGDVLQVYPVSEVSQQASAPKVHVVKSGQNPSKIAANYGISLRDLYQLNGWRNDPVLQVGQRIVVRR